VTTLRRAFRRLFTVLVVVYGALMLAVTLFLLFDRSNHALIEFGKIGLLYTLLSAPLVLLTCLVFRRWRLILWTLPPLLLGLAYFGPLFLPKSNASPPDARQISVMTFNINSEFGTYDVLDVIREHQPDVVALTELGAGAAGFLQRRLGDLYPYDALHGAGGHYNYFRGQGIFSKYPVIETDYWRYEDLAESHGHQRAVIDVDGTPVTIYNVHPWPPMEWDGGLSFYVVPENDAGHRETIRRLLERAASETGPVILAGDFNLTDQFAEYADITARYRDSFREAGVGLGNTYPANKGRVPALIRIDYIFHSPHFTALDAAVVYTPTASDHYPLLATLALAP
jgi:endonuclease/exonuclease/phosphatase (EEP) superfamily protein YafD